MKFLHSTTSALQRLQRSHPKENEMSKQANTRKSVRNGIKAPQRQGLCMYAWDLFDSATKAICASHMPKLAEMTGLNLENLLIELRRWKRFNGLPTGARG
jgi:hypothetical protein